MATEKGKSSSSDGAKKSSSTPKKPNIFSVFAVGVLTGILAGFMLGWWYPAPDKIRDDIDTTKAATNDHIHEIADQARKKTADMLEERAKQLRTPLGHTLYAPEEPADSIDQKESSVPIE